MAHIKYPTLSTLDEFLAQQYDFIVVGGGTAGLAVAARLSEIPSVHVGVLEAGKANWGEPAIMTPALYTQAIANERFDWRHHTVAQVHASGKCIEWPRGKGLGGSSAINYQMYNRGQKSDYDDWEKLGLKGWSFASLLPYFKKHESFDAPSSYAQRCNFPLDFKHDPSFHGTRGPVHTSFSVWRPPQEDPWMQASEKVAQRLGVPTDSWSGDHLGTYSCLSTINRDSSSHSYGTRSYSATGYLLPNAHRPNLHVLIEAVVHKLVVANDGSITGVTFENSGKVHTVSVKKEVILSAGTIKTPQILELSGIGDPSTLAKAGVKCLIENRHVGENLSDHVVTALNYELIDGELSLDSLQDPSRVQVALDEYATKKEGPLSSAGSGHQFASMASLCTKDEIEKFQAQVLKSDSGLSLEKRKILAAALADVEDASMHNVFIGASFNIARVDDQVELFKTPAEMVGKNGVTVSCAVARPFSVGSCHITNDDPTSDPEIDPRYCADSVDAEILAKCVDLTEKIFATSPLKEKVKRRTFPSEDVDLRDEETRVKFVKEFCGTSYHPIGTVAMGKDRESGACDDRLRVFGTKGLRVVDASIMPLHVGGNIVSTVYAIAEKGADMIKEDWGLSK